jgi:hypothetical protein
MPRRNRFTPFDVIVAVPERGTIKGNRGVLHDPDGRIRRPWQVKHWLVCLLGLPTAQAGGHTVLGPEMHQGSFADRCTGSRPRR